MANIRIISDNAAFRATVAATSLATDYVAASLQTDSKSEFIRTNSTSTSISADFTSDTTADCVAFPFTNFTSGVTIRVRLYTAASGLTPVYDSGTLGNNVAALPYSFNPRGNVPAGANGFAYGTGRAVTFYFPKRTDIRKVLVDFVDSGNPQGVLELSFLIIGAVWEPFRNFDLNSSIAWKSSSLLSQNGAWDSLVAVGGRTKVLSFDLSTLTDVNRDAVYSVFRDIGPDYPIFISAFPLASSKTKEEEYTIYGRLPVDNSLRMPTKSRFITSIEVTSL